MSKSKLVHKGRFIDVYEETVRLPNGNTVVLDIVRHPGASAVVPVLDNGEFVLLRQYRHAVGGYLYEIPAGKLDIEGEDPLECAKRELAEETGFAAKNWRKLISIHTTPGFTNEVIHIYLATGLTEGMTSHEHDEIIEIVRVDRKRLEAMIDAGEITDAKTLVGLFKAISSMVQNPVEWPAGNAG